MQKEKRLKDEAEIAYENNEMFVVLPQIPEILDNLSYHLSDKFNRTEKRSYSSRNEPVLTKEEIKTMIKETAIAQID